MGPGAAVDLLLQDALIDPYSVRHMGEITEDLIASYGITRREQDAWAVRSYERAQAAVKTGLFAEEIVPVRTLSKKGEMTVAEDEEPFRVDFEKFASLRPVFKKDGTITAANASTINDGAALALLAGEAAVGHFGLQPLARLVAYATHSLHPDRFGEAPVGAIDRVCALAGLQVSDIGLFEINEAFAAVPLMAVKRLGLGMDKVNVNGGAVALGHPVGASGGRLVATLARELRRRSERYGLATLCIGGGEAVAAIFERI
jgi:acetyl-CoA C-acetyltransferase